MANKRNIVVIILEAEFAETEKQFFNCLMKDHLEDLQNKLNINYIQTIAVEHCKDIKTKERQKLTILSFEKNKHYEIYFLLDRDCEIPVTSFKINAIKNLLCEVNSWSLASKKIIFNQLMLPRGHSFEYVLCMCFPYSLIKKYSSQKLINNYKKVLVDNGPFEKEQDWKKGTDKKLSHTLDKIGNHFKTNNVIDNLLENFKNRVSNEDFLEEQCWIGELFLKKRKP